MRTTSTTRTANDDLVEEEGTPLQASWSEGEVVVWAAGPGTEPATNDELADRLEAHRRSGPGLDAASRRRAAVRRTRRSLVDPCRESLGWLVAVGGGLGPTGSAPACAWLGRVVAGRRAPGRARGAVAADPAHHQATRPRCRRWPCDGKPALLDDATLDRLAAIMPGPVGAWRRRRSLRVPSSWRSSRAVVNAIVTRRRRPCSSCRRRRRAPHRVRRRRGGHHPTRRLAVPCAVRRRAPTSPTGSSGGRSP